jgi:anthranilate/para-aminobenzoate synthase component II
MLQKRVLLIDNYDSYTYNLFQLLEQTGVSVDVIKNDEISWNTLQFKLPQYEAAVISPGPGTPCNWAVYYQD